MIESPDPAATPSKDAPRASRSRRTIIAAGGATAVAGAVMVISAVGAPSAGAVVQDKVTFCHETGSNTNVYVEITTAAAGLADGHYSDQTHNHGQGQITVGDIIPSFTYQQGKHAPVTYAGQNLGPVGNTTGAAILDNGCVVPSSSSSSSAASSTVVVTTPAPVTKTVSNPDTTKTITAPGGVKTVVQAGPVVTEVVNGAAAGAGAEAAGAAQGPIPAGVNAGLHTTDSNAGLKAWGILLMLLGGAAGLVFGLRPSRGRAH